MTGKPDIAHGKGAPGKGQLYIDGKFVGESEIPLTNPLNMGLISAINCGADVGAPVTPKYKPPFPFTGKIHKVTVDVSGELIKVRRGRDAQASSAAVRTRRDESVSAKSDK